MALLGCDPTRFSALELLDRQSSTGLDPGLIIASVSSLLGASTNMLYNISGTLYWNGSVVGGGSGGTPTWEAIFALDNTFTITPDATWTIAGNRNTATNVVTMSNAAGASGAILAFSNATTSNNDVLGTGSTWAVTGAGGATFAGMIISGTSAALSTTGNATWTLKDNSSTALTIASSGNTSFLIFDTTDSAELIKFGKSMQVTDGNATFISSSNTVANVLITNNSITTFGAAANSAGAVIIRSTSLTTGSLLQLQLSDTSNVGGFYLTCRESVGGTNDFTIGENGVIAMAGTGGSDSINIAAGNVTLTSGSITLTDGVFAQTSTGTADVMSVTADSLLANNLAIFKGSGAFTGTTSSSFVAITPTGLTTGTALYIAGAAATTLSTLVDVTSSTTTGIVMRLVASGTQTGVGQVLAMSSAGTTTTTGLVSLTANSITTGIGVNLTSTSTGWTSGNFLNIGLTSSGTLAARTGAAVAIASSMTHTADTDVTQSFSSMTIARTSIRNTGGADTHTTTSQGALLSLSNTITATTGTITDTMRGINITMASGGTGEGVLITHNSTTAIALSVASSGVSSAGVVKIAATALTSNQALLISATGTYTGTGIVTLTATGMTTGSAVLITSGGANLAAGGKALEIAMGAATAGNGATITTSGVYVGTGLELITCGAMTTGIGLSIVATTGMTTGSLIRATTSTAGAIATNGAISLTATGNFTSTSSMGFVSVQCNSTTAGVAVDIEGTAMTTGVALHILATAATLTTGAYIQCDDGSVKVFSVGLAGHLQSRGTAPTVALNVANGLSGVAIAASNTDTCGTITTTGTPSGTNTIRVTFTKTWAFAPKVFIMPANAAASAPNTAFYVSNVTTTTFDIIVPTAGTYAVTPSWHYFAIESGSSS